jgi:hypothetical protein
MAKPHEKLADSLSLLHQIQKKGAKVVRTTDLTRVHRERLIDAGYLTQVMKGWFIYSSPQDRTGDSTAWYTSMRDFVMGYADERFGEDWCVNPELSLQLLTAVTRLPKQVVLHTPNGDNNIVALPAGTSIFAYKAKDFPPAGLRVEVMGLRAYSLEAALVRVNPNIWQTDPSTMRLALAQLRDADDLSRILLDGEHSVIAGRLIGALEAVGRGDLGQQIHQAMTSVGYVVNRENPFAQPVAPVRLLQESPYCGRIRDMWDEMRTQVLENWSLDPQPVLDANAYLDDMEVRYVTDAYHSLSIEGYHVTPELIEKVRAGKWSPDGNDTDKRDRDTMAARGYYDAHLRVRDSLAPVLAGENAGTVLKRDLQSWYQSMWRPSVTAGILKPSDLAGWRNGEVYIRNSMHTPPKREAVRDTMPVFFELLEQEESAAVRVVLGHFVFVFIHPYMDGNGRLARFLMNTMLASGGWPWTVIPVETRSEYMKALEAGSADKDIVPFTKFVAKIVEQQLGKPLEIKDRFKG